MDEYISQIGIGGIFALLLIREVLTFLEKRDNNPDRGRAGDKPVEFWREQFGDIIRDSMNDGLAKELREIRNDTTRLRETQHKSNEILQQISNKLDWQKLSDRV